MILETDFTVAAPAERVWTELLDLEGLAACLPGADLQRVDGDSTLQGTLKPQIGGSAIECLGTLRPIDVDEDDHSASCALRVRQLGGSAFATGTLRGRVAEADGSTLVSMSLEGRLAAVDVSEDRARDEAERLLKELASRLEKSLGERASRPEPAARPEPTPAPAPPQPPPGPRPLDRPAPPPPPPTPPSAPAQRVPVPAASGAAGALALLLALVFGRRKRRRGVWFEIRYRW